MLFRVLLSITKAVHHNIVLHYLCVGGRVSGCVRTVLLSILWALTVWQELGANILTLAGLFILLLITLDMLGGAVQPHIQHLYKNCMRLFIQAIFSLSYTLPFFALPSMHAWLLHYSCLLSKIPSAIHAHAHICGYKTIRIVLPSTSYTLCH